MKLIKWFTINGMFAGLIYAGYVMGIEGAENVALFFAWVNIIFSFFLLHDEVIKKIKEKGRTVPAWLNATYNIAIATTFTWFGAWITGAFWIVRLLLLDGAYQKAAEQEA